MFKGTENGELWNVSLSDYFLYSEFESGFMELLVLLRKVTVFFPKTRKFRSAFYRLIH